MIDTLILPTNQKSAVFDLQSALQVGRGGAKKFVDLSALRLRRKKMQRGGAWTAQLVLLNELQRALRS